ncbi:Protein MAINTENANCE OF MERISTEMS, partial [Camellia lanceoleosa]
MEPGTPKEASQYGRGFLMFLFGTTLFADKGNTVGLYLLSALVDLSQVRRYDWGGAGLATLYCYMSATSRGWGDLLGGYWRAWELWVYVYFPTLAPKLVVEGPLATPYSLVFEGQHRPRPRESLLYLRQYFDTVRSTEGWCLPRQILFEGPPGPASGSAWPSMGYTLDPPQDPSEMRLADRLSSRDVVNAMLGTNTLLHLEEGDYATYHHIYLMPPLTGVRTPTMRPASMPSSSQAQSRVADAPSTSRASTSRGGGRSVPPIPLTYHHPGWPDMPTELMGWQYGTTSPIPIPIEPPMPGHRYVRDPDSPPYMDQVLKMVASLEGMVLWREAQLAHIIEEEPGEDEEEEAADRQSETSADREEGSGLGSESGGEAEGDPEDDSSDWDGDGGAELWVYVYFPTLAPELVVERPLVTPYSLVFEGQHRPRPQESLLYLQQYFDMVRSTEVFQNSQFFVFSSLILWVYTSKDPPSAPPVEMRIADRLSSRDIVNAMLGTDALLHLEEGDYATYRHIYLMPPLTGVRTPTMRPAGMTSSSQAQARAADAPSTSRAGTSRGGGGLVPSIPPTYHHPGWPDMPTELMGWQYGTTSPIPIPIEPPMPGHRYVRDPDSPPPPVEYMDQVLEMVASLEGM